MPACAAARGRRLTTTETMAGVQTRSKGRLAACATDASLSSASFSKTWLAEVFGRLAERYATSTCAVAYYVAASVEGSKMGPTTSRVKTRTVC